jgi:hypothetical protein
MVAEEFEGVASFSECEPLRDQPLKFDRADFRANLFRLRTPLRGFAVVELAVNASLVAMKYIDEGPEEVGEIGFETGVEKEARQGFDGGLEREGSGVRRGQGARIRFVVQGAIAVRSQFVQNAKKEMKCRGREQVSND